MYTVCEAGNCRSHGVTAYCLLVAFVRPIDVIEVNSLRTTLVKHRLCIFFCKNRDEPNSAELPSAGECVATCVLFTFDGTYSWFYYRVKMQIDRNVFTILSYYSWHTMRLEAKNILEICRGERAREDLFDVREMNDNLKTCR